MDWRLRGSEGFCSFEGVPRQYLDLFFFFFLSLVFVIHLLTKATKGKMVGHWLLCDILIKILCLPHLEAISKKGNSSWFPFPE